MTTIENTALDAALTRLESDASALGWDQPSVIYALSGDPADPIIRRVGDTTDHPAVYVNNLHNFGVRFGAGTFGVALVHEAWRSACAKDVKVSSPAVYDRMRQALLDQAREVGAVVDEKDIDEAIDRGLHQATAFMMQSGVSLASAPTWARVEIRSTTAIFREQSMAMVIRRRSDNSIEKNWMYIGQDVPDWESAGRVPSSLYRFLIGEVPEPPDEPTKATDTLIPRS